MNIWKRDGMKHLGETMEGTPRSSADERVPPHECGTTPSSSEIAAPEENSKVPSSEIPSAEVDHCSRSGKVSRDPRLLQDSAVTYTHGESTAAARRELFLQLDGPLVPGHDFRGSITCISKRR